MPHAAPPPVGRCFWGGWRPVIYIRPSDSTELLPLLLPTPTRGFNVLAVHCPAPAAVPEVAGDRGDVVRSHSRVLAAFDPVPNQLLGLGAERRRMRVYGVRSRVRVCACVRGACAHMWVRKGVLVSTHRVLPLRNCAHHNRSRVVCAAYVPQPIRGKDHAQMHPAVGRRRNQEGGIEGKGEE